MLKRFAQTAKQHIIAYDYFGTNPEAEWVLTNNSDEIGDFETETKA